MNPKSLGIADNLHYWSVVSYITLNIGLYVFAYAPNYQITFSHHYLCIHLLIKAIKTNTLLEYKIQAWINFLNTCQDVGATRHIIWITNETSKTHMFIYVMFYKTLVVITQSIFQQYQII